MFGTETVSKVESALEKVEQRTKVPVVIETITSIPGLEKDASAKTKNQAIEQLAEKRSKEIGYEGVYLLISKNDHVFSKVLVREHLDARLPREERLAIRDALIKEFKAGRYDDGLVRAAKIIDSTLASTVGEHANPREAVGQPLLRRGQAQPARFGLGSLLLIGLGIFGVLLLIRTLGGLFGRSAGGYPTPMGMGGMSPGMGPGPGYGPGYGGYGGRGGGFFSGMLGGLGGALAGNWLYDQFSGRHSGEGHVDASSYNPTSTDPGSEGFVGGDDYSGGGTSWDDPGTADPGGDWGGGDGGGDWGGGGGDWGGGDGGGW